jgi:2-oxoglutarate dehydrogenase E1 component
MFFDTNKLGMAEHLLWILEGFDVRISGQDVERGTFSSSCGRKVEDSEEEVTLIDRLEVKKL